MEKIPIRSFARTLTHRIMLMLMATMLAIALVVFFFVKAHMDEVSAERYQDLLLQNNEYMRTVLSDVQVATVNNVHAVEEDIANPETMYQHVERIVRQNTRILGAGILFEADYYPEKGHWFEVYAMRDSNNTISARQIGSKTHNYLESDWYKNTMADEYGDWSAPYFDREGAGQVLVSFFTQIRDKKGHKVGLLGADVSLEGLRKRMKKIDEINNHRFKNDDSRKSYSFIIDRNGNYVLHPDADRILLGNFLEEVKAKNDTIDENLIQRMIDSGQGECRLIINGKLSRVYYCSLAYADWATAIVVPETAIYSNGQRMGLIILGVMLAGLLAIYFLSHFTIKRTSKPLTDFAAQAASVEKELKIAHDIQMGMLPSSSKKGNNDKAQAFVNESFKIHASLTPAREVGGDFYDYFLRDEKLFFCIGDVSGKGVPAALVMSMAQSSFRVLNSRESSPEEIVTQMNEILGRDNEYCTFITLFVGVLDLPTGRLRYTNAGHKAPILISGKNDDEEEESGEHKMEICSLHVEPNLPIGTLPDLQYSTQETVLAPGDIIFVFTDGLTEAENHTYEQFGDNRMTETIRKIESTITPSSLIEAMTASVHAFAGETEQSDDLTMLAIQYTRRRRTSIISRSLTLPNDVQQVPRLAELVEQVCEEIELVLGETMQLNLAIEEAVVNVMNYAYPPGQKGDVEITAEASKERIKFTIIDSGKPFDPTTLRPVDTTLGVEERDIGGLGIHLMRHYMDSINYERRNGQNILTLRKQISD